MWEKIFGIGRGYILCATFCEDLYRRPLNVICTSSSLYFKWNIYFICFLVTKQSGCRTCRIGLESLLKWCLSSNLLTWTCLWHCFFCYGTCWRHLLTAFHDCLPFVYQVFLGLTAEDCCVFARAGLGVDVWKLLYINYEVDFVTYKIADQNFSLSTSANPCKWYFV